MHIQPGPSWLFIDMNSYFASCEQQDNPHLRGRPVAVVPMMTDATCAIAASYEAKRYGVKTGTKIYDAKKMCPDLKCVLARHDVYVKYHHRILEEIVRHTPINKVWSIDELSSRLPPSRRNAEAIIETVRRLKNGIHANVGVAINCSVGAAPNSLLAKLASNMQKPDGLTILEPHNLEERLFALSLRDLPGINVNMEARLHRAGITSVEALYKLSPKHARKIWGSVAGERFWYLLHGYDLPDIETHPSVIGHSRVLDPALRPPPMAFQMARRLTVKAAGRLRAKEFYATRFHLSVRGMEERWEGEAKLSPCQDNFAFLKALEALWNQMMATMKPRTLKKVSVTMYGLCKREEITPDLFETTSDSYRRIAERNEKLSGLMDSLNARYGAETVRLGETPRTRAGFVGTKIAFSRVPDLNEFHQ